MQHQISPNDRETALIGTLLGGRWLVHGELGAGGMGRVYSAIHTHNGRRVAIKVLNQAVAHNPEVRERFYQEAYAANLVVHPGTVAALDDGCLEDGTPYLVMELLNGRDLEGLFNDAGPLDEGYVVSLIIELLSILESAHDAGVLHRDIKPENIFCTSDGKVKLLDFGIAKVSESQRTHHTQWGATMGTPAYMPPEQARGRWDELDARSDLWSVGATMFALLSGKLVHSGSTVNELLLSAMTQMPPSLQSVAPHISSTVAKIVDRALQFEPSDRYSSATEMRNDLIAALNHREERTEPSASNLCSPPRPEASRPRTTHRPVVSSEITILHEPPTKRRKTTAILLAALCLGAALSTGVVLSGDAALFPVENSPTVEIAGVTETSVEPAIEELAATVEVRPAAQQAPLASEKDGSEQVAEPAMDEAPEEEALKKPVQTSAAQRFNYSQRSTMSPNGSMAHEEKPESDEVSAQVEVSFDPLARRR